jgi:diguanylate cyclase (GGDEF)-like protein
MDNGRKKLGFRSIRNRILIFSILVTLVPSFGMGWFWFDITRKATTDKIEQKLIDSAGIAEREISLWFKERHYDLRVFANSFVVLDNLNKYYWESGQNSDDYEKKRRSDLKNIATYLTLIKKQFTAYRRFLVLDRQGRILATSDAAESDRSLALPGDWKSRIDSTRYFTGDVQFVGKDLMPLMPLGIPLFSGKDSSHLGFFVMEVELRGLLPLLTASLPRTGQTTGTVALLAADGRSILAASPTGASAEKFLALSQITQLHEAPLHLQEIVNNQGERLVGLLSVFNELSWQFVITEKYYDVFAGVIEARNRIILITILLTVAIGGTASIVAGQIIIPLESLTDGVLRVAGGDLDVTVPIRRDDELGIVGGMFNEMVRRLKEDQAKLELLATTDPLTGLANRKQIMADLSVHQEHYRRYGTDFSVLMIDIDYFKRINDNHGHQTGDAVLVQLARIFRETLRSLDSAGRYGGEEFLVILGQTDMHQAMQTAERIRQATDQHVFVCGDVSLRATISVGVAGIFEEDTSSTELIGRADKALYEAKAGGRNRVELG